MPPEKLTLAQIEAIQLLIEDADPQQIVLPRPGAILEQLREALAELEQARIELAGLRAAAEYRITSRDARAEHLRALENATPAAASVVYDWDVADGEILGATIRCRTCGGGGAIGLNTCTNCSGSGRLHRPYRLPDGSMIDLHVPGPKTVQERAARGDVDAVERMKLLDELGREHAMSIAANAIGFEMFRHDERRVSPAYPDVIIVADEEAERCRAAAKRVVDHLEWFQLKATARDEPAKIITEDDGG